MIPAYSKRLTIFEGPDGGGKSTAARLFADGTNARYVHCGSFPGVGPSLGRFYIDAMLPALLGYQDVVLDRCWLSEGPYGEVFRPTKPPRIDSAVSRILSRVALRCQTNLVYCLPEVELCLEAFRGRKGIEMLEREDQLVQVHQRYVAQAVASDLPVIRYDRGVHQPGEIFAMVARAPGKGLGHPTYQQTAGNWFAPVCLVGDTFADHKDADSLYQWPFASMSKQGCSHWLADYLTAQGVSEHRLLWANADFDLNRLTGHERRYIALGAKAGAALTAAGIEHDTVPHPQHQKRFNSHDDYALGAYLRAYLN